MELKQELQNTTLLEWSTLFLWQTWSVAFVASSFMINTRVLNLFWMETNRRTPPVSPTRNTRFWWSLKLSVTHDDGDEKCAGRIFTGRTFKNACILFYKVSPLCWMAFCTCSKSPTSRSKKPVSLACFLFFLFFCRWLSSKTFEMFVLCSSRATN